MATDQDQQIINGLKAGPRQREAQESALYLQFEYLIDVGCRKYHLSVDDGFTAYTEALLAVISNIVNDHFDGRSSIKTYLTQIFFNKCVDLTRTNTTNKQSVHQSAMLPELLVQLPDGARDIVQKMINDENLKVIQICLEALGEPCKKILLLFGDQFTDKQIAEETIYKSAASVKTTRLRCMDKLKQKVMEFTKRR